jgi:hypothetical protein
MNMNVKSPSCDPIYESIPKRFDFDFDVSFDGRLTYDNASPALRAVMKEWLIRLIAGEKTVNGLLSETQAAFQRDLSE